jgi:hypothetical protein
MSQISSVGRALIIASFALSGCHAAHPEQDAEAYVVALRSVQADVFGDPPAAPLALDSATRATLDSVTLRALMTAGVIASCRRISGGTACVMLDNELRGLVLHATPLKHLTGGRVSLSVMVQGRAAPGDETLIVGQPYVADIELARSGESWRIVRKVRRGPSSRAT